jgi:hypothetical protein
MALFLILPQPQLDVQRKQRDFQRVTQINQFIAADSKDFRGFLVSGPTMGDLGLGVFKD